ncbi:MAG: tetratricopeptide repeat protein [candidate division WOR-3 bacterium]
MTIRDCSLLVIGLWALASADVGGLMRQGNSLFARGKYDAALGCYQRAEVLEPDATAIHFNIGNTYYRLGKHQEALSELSLSAIDRNPKRKSAALYNIGNVLYRTGRIEDAIASYKLALLANPNDQQAKENLEFCLKKRQEQKDSTGQQQPQQQPQPDQQQPERRPQPQPGMSKDQAEQILQAVENKERKTQKDAHRPRRRQQVEKDW